MKKANSMPGFIRIGTENKTDSITMPIYGVLSFGKMCSSGHIKKDIADLEKVRRGHPR